MREINPDGGSAAWVFKVEKGMSMQRHRRPQARVIAYAIPQQQRQVRTWAAVAAGLLASLAIYAAAAILS